jgi:hypothetical protein
MKLLARDFVVSQTVINRCYESDEGACDLAPFLPSATFPFLFVRSLALEKPLIWALLCMQAENSFIKYVGWDLVLA